MKITAALLVDALRMPRARAQQRVESINAAIEYAELTTTKRLAHYLGQVGHETYSFFYRREIWGPTAAQKRYERDFSAPWPSTRAEARSAPYRANRLAWNLGNVLAGDGLRYMGRGDIQTTGRANYRQLTKRLRDRGIACPDFEAQPALLEQDPWVSLSAADYWVMRNINDAADADDLTRVTRLVNGGENGIAHRQALYASSLAALMRMES